MKKAQLSRVLPETPDIHQLKRQAKEWLAALRAGDENAAAESAFYGCVPDPKASTLSRAQFVLARSYGFDSWPKLKAYVDGVTVKRFVAEVRARNGSVVKRMLKMRPELVHMDIAENDEHRALHFAVLDRAPEMVRVLMEFGADARKGIYPYRPATNAMTLAVERGFDEIATILREEEARRQRHRTGGDLSARKDLSRAILDRKEDEVLAMLDLEPGLVDAVDGEGWTPLHLAASVRSARLVEELLGRGSNVNRRGPEGETPLDRAVATGWRRGVTLEAFSDVALLLCGRGAELSVRSAVALGELEWLRGRQREGKLANSIEHAGGLLSIAVKHGRVESLELLLEFGFDPDERMRFDEVEEAVFSWGTPLWYAAGSGQLAFAKLLLKRGADPNGQVYASGTPVYSAYGQGDRAMVDLLVSHGGVVDAATIAHYRETDLARQMLADHDAGALPEGAFGGEGLAEELLWGAACGGAPEIVRMALDRVGWLREDSRWHYVLKQPFRHWNHMNGPWANPDLSRDAYFDCFCLILSRCDPNVRGKFGLTALHDVSPTQVSAEERVSFAKALLDAGARVDVRDDLLRSTPLGWACRWGHVELVELFLDRGADLVEADAEVWATPRAWAAKMGHDRIAAILEESRGDS